MRYSLASALILGLVLAATTVTSDAAGALRARAAERLAKRSVPPEVPATPLAAGERITRPGRYRITLRHDGIERFALIHVPENHPAAAPLVMALHGGGGSAAWQANDATYGLISSAEQAGYVAVFPNGTSSVSNGMFATWNAGNCCAKARDAGVDDVGFLRAVVADVQSRMDIDSRRVFAIGMSNGGMMAYRLACEAADIFRGIMSVAGTDTTRECKPSRPVAVLHIHARNDDLVLFAGGAGKKFRREAQVTDFDSVTDIITRWVHLDHAATEARQTLSVPGATCEQHDAGDDGAPVQLCVTETGGHSWPGGSKPKRGAEPSQAIRANDLMWAFFSSLTPERSATTQG